MRLDQLVDAYGAVAAAEAARRLGVLAALAAGPATATALARSLRIEARATAGLLSTLAALGVVDEEGGRYALAPEAVILELMRFWEGLEPRLSAGVPLFAFDRPESAGQYRAVVGLMAAWQARTAEQAAAALASEGLEMVDVGAGAATWSLPLAASDPRRRVTAWDRAVVLEAARERVAALGLGAAYTFEACDLLGADLGEDRYDLAVVGQLCHLFGEEDNRRLLAKVARAVRPGGAVAIVETLHDDDPRRATLHALSLLVRTAHGDVHPFASYGTWLCEAGLCDLRRERLPGPPAASLIVARKPRG